MTETSRLTLIIDSVPAYVAYVTLADLRYRLVNKRFEEAFRRPQQEIVGRHIREIIGEENYHFALPYIDEVRQGRSASYVNRFNIAQGTRWIKVHYIPDRDGGEQVVGIIVLSYDITELKLAEEAVDRSKEQYRSTIDAFEDSLIAVDREMTLVLANRSFRKNHEARGFDPEIVGRKLPEALPYIPQKSLDEYGRIFTDGRPITTEHAYRIGGQEVCAETRKIPVFENGEVTRILTIVRDLTEKRALEQELNKAQRLESIGELAGGIAHDFNNILTSLYGNIQLARMAAEVGSEQWRYLKDSENACRQAEKLTSQLLTFARGGEPIKQVVDLSAVLDHAASFSLRGSNVSHRLKLPATLWHVEADEGQLGQVFNNLVINADQAMPDGGTITIEAENIVLDETQPRPVPCEPGRYVRIRCIDQGLGIPPGHLSKIFDPFFSTKQKGSGLGLTTCFSIVKRHGGHIEVSSELGEGSCFIVYLPASEATAVPQPPPRRPAQGSGKVLFMDDDRTVRKIAAHILRRLGYRADLAEHGEQALAMHAAARRANEPYDCVILDLTVAGGMGGKECLAKLLAVEPTQTVIITSGYSNDPIMADHRAHGAAGVLPKPFSMELVAQTLESVLDRPEGDE
ncbi:MAG: PAS domain-containing protein [Myxococcales bacterium]|nr:PAS domain-containing protein [Myxococcales bacterium]